MTILPAPPPNWKRPRVPMKTQRDVALDQLGFESPQLDHDPALGLRSFDTEANDTIPAANSRAHLKWMSSAAHRAKTGGRRGEQRSTSYGSDAHAMAKLDRLTPQQEAVRRAITKPCGAKRQPTGNFPRGRKMQSRNEFRRKTT